MRSKFRERPHSWDEYRDVLAFVASKVVSVSNGMSGAFLYESAKDTLKWHDLSVKEHIVTIMHIGTLYHLSDEDFAKIGSGASNELLEADVINEMAIAQEKARNGNNKSNG